MEQVLSSVANKFAYNTWEHRLGKIKELEIPLYDEEAWDKYPDFRWMFNKLVLSQVQSIKAAPHGVIPEEFPCFSKPIYNLYGLSAHSYTLHEWNETLYQPGHMWMEYLGGQQRSVDFLVYKGAVVWLCSMLPTYWKGSIVKWETEEKLPEATLSALVDWIHTHFKYYTGCVNLEAIDDKVIESVPRLSTQFLDFFGDNYLNAVALLYSGEPVASIGTKQTGYSKILRVPKHNARRIYYVANKKELRSLENCVYSIKLPWYEGRPLYEISDDPYSYRLAIVNGEDEENIDYVLKTIKKKCLVYEE